MIVVGALLFILSGIADKSSTTLESNTTQLRFSVRLADALCGLKKKTKSTLLKFYLIFREKSLVALFLERSMDYRPIPFCLNCI